MTGIHNQTEVSVPGNQMFVKFETSSTVVRKGFEAFIHKIGIVLRFLKNFTIENQNQINFHLLQMIIVSIGRT